MKTYHEYLTKTDHLYLKQVLQGYNDASHLIQIIIFIYLFDLLIYLFDSFIHFIISLFDILI